MTITIDRKRVNSIDLFPTIEDFIVLLKSEYNSINFYNENIKSSILSIYNQVLHDDGNILYLRFNRWLPSKFGFKFNNKFSLGYWLERGFNKDDYDRCIKEKSENTKKTQTEFRKKQLIEKIKFDVNYSNTFRLNSSSFNSYTLPICNECKNNLSVKSSSYFGEPVYKITGCSNLECITNNTNIKDIKWRAYLPKEKYDEIKNNLKSVKRSFSKEFWINKGYSEQEAIYKVFDIQSKNSKKFTGKRTGKSKDVLREKGYSEEEIRKACLSMCNIEYWMDRGFTNEESKIKVFNHQSNASKHVDYEKRLLPSNKEYWRNKGFTENESLQKVKESQTTFSKEICINKYGEEKGIEIFNKRTKKWLESLHKNENLVIGYSNISQILFDIVKERTKIEYKYATNGGEFKIKRKDGGYYVYDFIDIDNNKIIEYNGDMYHANPMYYIETDNPHPFRKNITAKDIWDKDFHKIKLAEDNGFEVLTIWDSEFRYKGKLNKELIIQKCINFLTDNK